MIEYSLVKNTAETKDWRWWAFHGVRSYDFIHTYWKTPLENLPEFS